MIGEWYWVRDGTVIKLFSIKNPIYNKTKESCLPNFVCKTYAEMYSYIAAH